MKPDTFVVETSYGPVRGLKRTSAVGDQFFSFRGIPYAKPPVGELRFRVNSVETIITVGRIGNIFHLRIPNYRKFGLIRLMQLNLDLLLLL